MNKILLTIFALLLLPYVGIPYLYDRWIVFGLILLLLVFVYLFSKKRKGGGFLMNSKEKDVSTKNIEQTIDAQDKIIIEPKEEREVLEQEEVTKKDKEQESIISEKDRSDIKEAVERSSEQTRKKVSNKK